jgi:hypothetical protein
MLNILPLMASKAVDGDHPSPRIARLICLPLRHSTLSGIILKNVYVIVDSSSQMSSYDRTWFSRPDKQEIFILILIHRK